MDLLVEDVKGREAKNVVVVRGRKWVAIMGSEWWIVGGEWLMVSSKSWVMIDQYSYNGQWVMSGE